MKPFLYIIGAVAIIVIIVGGLHRNNLFFNNGSHLGDLTYLTPGAAEAPAAGAKEGAATAAKDSSTTTTGTDSTKTENKAVETKEAGEKDKSSKSGH